LPRFARRPVVRISNRDEFTSRAAQRAGTSR